MEMNLHFRSQNAENMSIQRMKKPTRIPEEELSHLRRLLGKLDTENASLRDEQRSSDLERARLSGRLDAALADVNAAKAEVWEIHEELVAAQTTFEKKLEKHLTEACVKVRHLRQTRRSYREELALTLKRATAEVRASSFLLKFD